MLSVGRSLDQLGTPALSWADLLAIATNPEPHGALVRAVHGERALWSPEAFLLADVVDLLRGANWQRSGGKGPKPKPVPRPRMPDRKLTADELRRNGLQSGVIGVARPLPEIRAWLESKNGR